MNQYRILSTSESAPEPTKEQLLSANVCELLIINISTVLRPDLIGMRLY
jgi:hypothetical protein